MSSCTCSHVVRFLCWCVGKKKKLQAFFWSHSSPALETGDASTKTCSVLAWDLVHSGQTITACTCGHWGLNVNLSFLFFIPWDSGDSIIVWNALYETLESPVLSGLKNRPLTEHFPLLQPEAVQTLYMRVLHLLYRFRPECHSMVSTAYYCWTLNSVSALNAETVNLISLGWFDDDVCSADLWPFCVHACVLVHIRETCWNMTLSNLKCFLLSLSKNDLNACKALCRIWFGWILFIQYLFVKASSQCTLKRTVTVWWTPMNSTVSWKNLFNRKRSPKLQLVLGMERKEEHRVTTSRENMKVNDFGM